MESCKCYPDGQRVAGDNWDSTGEHIEAVIMECVNGKWITISHWKKDYGYLVKAPVA